MAFDVDGVLTDGSLYYTDQGIEIKAFNTLDGQGLKMLQQAGITVAIITGRKSRSVELRAQNLGIRHLFQAVDNKLEVMNSLLAELNLEPDDAGYMGDDVPDLPLMTACGFSATPQATAIRWHSATLCSPADAAAAAERYAKPASSFLRPKASSPGHLPRT
jgi:3-deoxy-D-manno-octulosonate 8-phosphate phosphatase (KDO 8-P phosphatase)